MDTLCSRRFLHSNGADRLIHARAKCREGSYLRRTHSHHFAYRYFADGPFGGVAVLDHMQYARQILVDAGGDCKNRGGQSAEKENGSYYGHRMFPFRIPLISAH
jgi:hypothetical protein